MRWYIRIHIHGRSLEYSNALLWCGSAPQQKLLTETHIRPMAMNAQLLGIIGIDKQDEDVYNCKLCKISSFQDHGEGLHAALWCNIHIQNTLGPQQDAQQEYQLAGLATQGNTCMLQHIADHVQ